MIKNIDFENIAILLDFDGTITTEDTNDKMVEKYGNENTIKIRKKFREGKSTFPEYFQEEISELRLTEDQYIDFLLKEIEISPGFLDFYKQAKEKSIRLGVISGGFRNGIIPFLRKYGIEDVEIFANELIFDDNRPHIEFLDSEYLKCCDKGPCGNCKIGHFNRYKRDGKKVMFVGDGTTDMPVAEVADLVFAKDSLAKYLDKRDIDYINYEDFRDINKFIFN